MEKLSTLQTTQINGMTITAKEAEEFQEYKREKYLKKVRLDMRKCVLSAGSSQAEVRRAIADAKSLCLASVKVPSSALQYTPKTVSVYPVLIDCVVGGDGTSHAKVKAFEAKFAAKNGAREITLMLNSDALLAGEFEQVKREVKEVKRAAKRAVLKLQTTITQKPVIYRLSKIAIECGVWMISIPYQEDLASLQEDMHGNCLVEFYGVEDCAVYKKLVQNGIVRIVSRIPRRLYDGFVLNTEREVALELNAKTEKAFLPV